MDNFQNSQPTTSFWPKNFKIKKKRVVVTSSDDCDLKRANSKRGVFFLRTNTLE